MDDIMECAGDASGRAHWVAGLGPRLRAMLADRVELEGAASAERLLAALEARPEVLVEAMLVDAATSGKRERAILDVARNALDALTLGACERAPGKPDRRALAWALYAKNRENLELVFHLDRVHRRGFRRLVANCSHTGDFARALTRESVDEVLAAFEQSQAVPRASRCAAVLHADDRTMVFIRRDHMRALFSQGVGNAFAFRREWIVLIFEERGQRLRLASTSTAAPVAIAEAIAAPIGYRRDHAPTALGRVEAFLRTAARETGHVRLVEVVVKQSTLPGRPNVTLSILNEASLEGALEVLNACTGETFFDVHAVAAVKLLVFGKRVLVHLEHQEGEVFVSYGDSTLVFEEREGFERLMEDSFGLVVRPMENRHAA